MLEGLRGRISIAVAAAWLALIAAASVRAQETVLQPAQAASERAQEAPPAEPAQAESPEIDAPAVLAAPESPPAAPAAPAEPAPAAVPSTSAPQQAAAEPEEPEDESRQPSYGARAVVARPLREEDLIGDYAQPRWTAHRRFPTTRVYVRPAGTIGVEYWLEYKQSLEDQDAARYRSQWELEMGLGHRLQLDFYLQTEQAGHQAPLELKAEKLELRWALADWDVIPLNPTVYFEFVRQHDGPPKVELKGLLGAELARRLHWGFNVVWEHELGDELENESALVSGVSYSAIDEVLSIGAEVKFETVDVKDHRFSFDNWELLAGPSLSWSPTPPMHVLLVALFGSETEGEESTALAEPTLVVGWEL